MKRVTRYFFLTMIAWALAACASSSDCFQEEVFCAALVTDTQGLDDHGINADAWAGLQQAQAEGLADRVEYIASVDSRDYAKNIAYFAEQGFDVVFTAGIALDDQTLRAADLYPDSVFVGLNQPFEESRPNLISVTFPEDQMGYAAGVVAATLTKTGIVAAVCEASGIDSMWRYCEGFRLGARSAREDVEVLVRYRENGDREKLFLDDEWGYQNGSELVGRGADVLFAAGGVTGQGALRAALDLGVYAIGAEHDQSAEMAAPSLGVVTSFYGQTRFEVQEVMRGVLEGQVPAVRVGKIQFVALNPVFSPESEAQLRLLLAGLESGALQIRVPKSR